MPEKLLSVCAEVDPHQSEHHGGAAHQHRHERQAQVEL